MLKEEKNLITFEGFLPDIHLLSGYNWLSIKTNLKFIYKHYYRQKAGTKKKREKKQELEKIWFIFIRPSMNFVVL